MMQYLVRIDSRRMPLFAAAFILLVAAMLVSWLILPQYKAQRAAAHEVSTLQQTLQAARAVKAEEARLQAEVERLELEMRNDVDGVSLQTLEVSVIGGLQDISWRRNVELVAVQSSPGARIGGVREKLFQLEVAGEYADLLAWLREIGMGLDYVTVRQLTLAPLDRQSPEPRLRAGLVIAAYASAE